MVQPGDGGVDCSVDDSLHDGSLIDVVAASGFLGIFGLRRGRENTALPPYVIRSHYVTMVDNNRGRFFLAVEPAYADVEYVFFISSRWYYMLLLSCRLHNCRPHRLDCGGCARARATFSSYGHAPYYTWFLPLRVLLLFAKIVILLSRC